MGGGEGLDDTRGPQNGIGNGVNFVGGSVHSVTVSASFSLSATIRIID